MARETTTAPRTRRPEARRDWRSRIVLRRSGIHGRGVYARTRIPKGTRIIEYVGDRVTKAESDRRSDVTLERSRRDGSKGAVYIVVLNKRHDIDGNVRWNFARHINHSCDPNCDFLNIRGHLWIVARRDIEPGEELSYNYGYDYSNHDEHPCRCGAPNCVGYIVDGRHFWRFRKAAGSAGNGTRPHAGRRNGAGPQS